MNITRSFSLEELIESQVARDHDINEQFNPPQEIQENLFFLCDLVLQPLRDALGPIHISSGWRCDRLNILVGGVSNSQHKTGEAADTEFYGPGGNQAIMDKIIELNIPFDQMINEFNLRWVHLSYSRKLKQQRRQVLKI